MTNWLRVMEAVERYASTISTYPGRRTGAALWTRHDTWVYGCNRMLGTPAAWKLDEDSRRNWFLHAEDDVLRRAQDIHGLDVARDGTVILNWFPCLPCAKQLTLAGVSRVIGLEPDWDDDRYEQRAAFDWLDGRLDVEIEFPLGTQAAWREAHDH